jgi:CRP/FNR family transcriptional regulator, cyclic AMP receptor protein
MQIKDLSGYGQQDVDRLLMAIPFYKEIKHADRLQLELLLQNSRIVELAPGEIIVKRGDMGLWLYFVLKGTLSVYLNEPHGEPINQIISGETFGDLAILAGGERRATVAAAKTGRGATVLGLDFNAFGALDDFSQIRLETKLQFYRLMVFGIRWKLEQKRLANPAHKNVQKMMATPLSAGPRGAVEELHGLHKQASALADILIDWNSESQFS